MVSISLVDVITYCRFVLLLTITDKLSSFAAAAMTHPDKLTVFIAIKYSRLKVTHTFQAFKAGDRA